MSRQPYEFGAKVGIATTLKHNLIVGAKAFSGNPFDGHTLNPQLEQATILMQDSGIKPVTAYVDLGYRGVDADNPGVSIKHRGKRKQLNAEELKLLKRRQAIEPVIGHLKQDHRMDRCHLKGEQGDGYTPCCARPATTSAGCWLLAAGCWLLAAGCWLLRMIAKKGVTFLWPLYLRLRGMAGMSQKWGEFVAQDMKLVSRPSNTTALAH